MLTATSKVRRLDFEIKEGGSFYKITTANPLGSQSLSAFLNLNAQSTVAST
jgi:hypothetical protein